MTLAHRTRKGTRAEAEASLARDILASNPKIVTSGEKEKEVDGNLKIKKCEKSITAWINRPLKSPSHNKDEEYEDGEEDVGTPIY